MTTILTPLEQDNCLQTTIQLALDNFSLASLIASLLGEYAGAGLQATVMLRGTGRGVDIPGKNCGFFTTPVIQMAILDCRRSLEFFGLTCDSKTNYLTSITSRRPDDLGIEHFGLSRITPKQFLQAVGPVVPAAVEPLLVDVHRWSNKQLAHFTAAQPSVTLETIHDVSIVMIEAYSRLLFEALGRPRPRIQPAMTELPIVKGHLAPMKWQSKLKVIAGTAACVGVLLGFFERFFAPINLVRESSSNYPQWLGWLGFILASVAVLGYIGVDLAGRSHNPHDRAASGSE